MSDKLVMVLTCNRPESLERCIDVATKNRKVASDEHWIIIESKSQKKSLWFTHSVSPYMKSNQINILKEFKRTELVFH